MQNAVTSNQTAKVDLDDYNPFDGKTTTNQNSAVMSATEEPPPAVTVQPQAPPSQVSTADFQVCHRFDKQYFVKLKGYHRPKTVQ